MTEQESAALLLIRIIQAIEVTEYQERETLNSNEEKLWESYQNDRQNLIPPTWEEFCTYTAIYLYKIYPIQIEDHPTTLSWGKFRAQTREFWCYITEAFGLDPSQVFLLTTAICNPITEL